MHSHAKPKEEPKAKPQAISLDSEDGNPKVAPPTEPGQTVPARGRKFLHRRRWKAYNRPGSAFHLGVGHRGAARGRSRGATLCGLSFRRPGLTRPRLGNPVGPRTRRHGRIRTYSNGLPVHWGIDLSPRAPANAEGDDLQCHRACISRRVGAPRWQQVPTRLGSIY